MSMAIRSSNGASHIKYHLGLNFIKNGIELGLGHFGYEEGNGEILSFGSGHISPLKRWNCNYTNIGIQLSAHKNVRLTVLAGPGIVHGVKRGQYIKTVTKSGLLFSSSKQDIYEKIKIRELAGIFQVRFLPLRTEATGLGISYIYLKSREINQHSILFTIPIGKKSQIPTFLNNPQH